MLSGGSHDIKSFQGGDRRMSPESPLSELKMKFSMAGLFLPFLTIMFSIPILQTVLGEG